MAKPTFNWRSFVTLCVALSFTLMALSGLVLYGAPRGRTANWSGWTFAWLERDQWLALHLAGAFVVLVVAAFHLYNNWRPFWNYLHGSVKRSFQLQRELLLALALVGIVAVGAASHLPPFNLLLDTNIAIKDWWEGDSRSIPVPHGESLALGQFGAAMGYTEVEFRAILESKGFGDADFGESLENYARQHKLSPQQFFEALELELRPMRRGGGGGEGRGQGRHRSAE